MNSRCALVSKIIPFSCVDGPGSRLALFLQGCNLRCKNCHNPWTMGRCNDCGECVPQCPHQALQIVDGKVVWNAVVCEQCDTCLKRCPQHATPMAQPMSVDEVLSHIRKAVLFIEGITVSGGEATTQLPFVVALFTAIKNDPQLRHLTCLVDSNGMLSETGWEKLLPVCDGAMLDLKAWGSECHQQLTGRDNQQIKRSICLLAERGKLAELRLLVIPDQVDYLHHIDELATFIKRLGDVPVRLNAFHAHGVYGEAQSWASATPEDVEPLADALKGRSICDMPDTAYGSAQTCRHDKTRQASHQALCADCRMLPTKGKLPTNAKQRIRIIKQHFGNLIFWFRAQLAKHVKHPHSLFRAVRLPLKAVERHIRRVGFQQQRCQR